MMNILNGGAHSDAPIDFQEFMIVPKGAPTFSEALRYGAEVFHALKSVSESSRSLDRGRRRGRVRAANSRWTTRSNRLRPRSRKPVTNLARKFHRARSRLLGILRPRAEAYVFKKSDGSKTAAEELMAFYQDLCRSFPIISIEDGCAEDDWAGWKKLTDALGAKCSSSVTIFSSPTSNSCAKESRGCGEFDFGEGEPDRHAHRNVRRIDLAKENKYTAVISHRSGETEDTTIADIAVATNVGQIKTGSLCRTDRVAKYNQLLRIEEELGDNAVYGGKMR